MRVLVRGVSTDAAGAAAGAARPRRSAHAGGAAGAGRSAHARRAGRAAASVAATGARGRGGIAGGRRATAACDGGRAEQCDGGEESASVRTNHESTPLEYPGRDATSVAAHGRRRGIDRQASFHGSRRGARHGPTAPDTSTSVQFEDLEGSAAFPERGAASSLATRASPLRRRQRARGGNIRARGCP